MQAIDIVMPQFGMGMREGTIVKWHVAVGDPVQQRDVIADVEVEKVDVVLESPGTGRILEILIHEGEPALVGEVLARIDAS